MNELIHFIEGIYSLEIYVKGTKIVNLFIHPEESPGDEDEEYYIESEFDIYGKKN